MELKEFFKKNPKAAIGFSGGVDSAYLLYAAKEYGADIQPYYIKTAFQPQFEYEDALRLCCNIGVNLKVRELDILLEHITLNPQNRCYYCKKILFSALKNQAEKDGYSVILDGTNASDNISDRQGMAALKELGVLSPLRECGLTKEKIRELSREAGLFTWQKPSYACLATRIPTGQEITADLLKRIEYSETALMNIGFSDFRIRIYNGGARIQLKDEQFPLIMKKRKEVLDIVKPYFETILLDLEAR